jgi:hypothetical protein
MFFICPSVLCPNLASKKKRLASSRKHKNIHSLCVGWRNHGILKINLVIRFLDKKELYINFKYELHNSISEAFYT